MSRKARAQITITDISDGEQYFIELSQENVVIPSNSTYGQLANCTATFWKKTGNGAKTAASMYCWVYARKGVSLTLISSASNLSQAKSSHTFSVNSDYLTTSYDAIVVYIYPTQGGFNPSSQYYAKKEIAITKNGDKGNKGDDGVAYTLTCSPAAVNFRRNAAGEFATAYINVSCEVKKSVGGTISDVTPGSGSGVYLFYRKLTTGSAQAWTQRTSASASQSVSYAEASAATYAVTGLEYALTSNNSAPNNANVLARTTVPVMLDGMNGAPGSTGKAFYSAGQWNSQTKYTANEYECPLVWIDAGSGGRQWYYLPEGESTNQNPSQAGTPGNPWKRAQNNWNVILTEALFADFASFQSAVITGDWLISKHGFCEGGVVDDERATYLDGGVAKPYYLKFDPTDPKGETTTNFKPNFALDLKTGTLYGSKIDISGTIHAENFFHRICFFDGVNYSNPIYRRTSEVVDYGDRFTEGEYYTKQEIESISDNQLHGGIGFVMSTGPSDIVVSFFTEDNEDNEPSYRNHVNLPDPDKYEGKVVRLFSYGLGSYSGDYEAWTDDGSSKIAGAADHIYADGTIGVPYANSRFPIPIGGSVEFVSAKLYGEDKHVWLLLENRSGGDIHIDGGGVIPSSGVSSVAGLTGTVSDMSLVNAIHDALTSAGFKTTDNNNTYQLTLNGTQKGTPGGADLGSFYAPTAIGSDGQFLKSTGSGAPSWSALPTATTSAAGIVQLGTGAAQAAKGDHSHNFLIPLAGGNVGSASGNNYLWIKRASKTADGTPNNGLVLEYGGSGTWTGQLYFADNGKDGVYFGGWYNGERVAWNKLAFVTDTVANAANATNAGNADTVDGRHASDFLLANGMYTENNGISDFSVNFPQNDNNDSKMDVDFNGGDTYNFDADVFVKYNNSWKEVLHTGTAYIENGTIYIGGNSIKPLTSEQYRGTVTQVKVGSTEYNPSNGVVTLPAYPTKASWNYDDRYQPLITNGTELLVGSLAAAGSINGSSADFDSLTSGNATVTGNLTVKGGGLLLTYPFTKVNGDTQTTPAFKTYWRKIGSYTFTGTGSSQAIIELFSGDGYNGNASQNSNAKITLKHGWLENKVAANSVGVICERYGYPCEFQVRVEATGYTTGHVWVLVPVGYGNGFYRVSGHGMTWTHNTAAADTTTDPTHNQRAVTYYDYQKKLTFVNTKNNETVDGNSNSFSAICFPFTKSVDGRITLDLSGISEQYKGTVTSVALSMPTGFTVSNSPVTSSGTLAVAFASGYSLLTSTQANTWNAKQDAIGENTNLIVAALTTKYGVTIGSGDNQMTLHQSGINVKSNGSNLTGFLKANGSVDNTLYSPASHNHDNTYLQLSGGTLSGNVDLKYTSIDASKTGNNISSTVWPSTMSVLDSSSRIITRCESIVNPNDPNNSSLNGEIGFYLYARQYNTSGVQKAQKGIKYMLSKPDTSGAVTGTWSVDDAASFRNAIGIIHIMNSKDNGSEPSMSYLHLPLANNNTGHYSLDLSGYQTTISDLAAIRSNATNGQTAYGWGNHATAGYAKLSDVPSTANFVTALGVSGDYLTYTKNGSTTTLTVPFATRASQLNGRLGREYAMIGRLATNIDSNRDLDSFLQAGTYTCMSGSIARTLSNTPYTGGNFRLWHIVNTGDDSDTGQWSAQLLLAPNSPRLYLRGHQSTGFTAWHEIAFVTDTVANATNAGNADTLDGVHANGLFTNLSNTNDGNLSLTIGGVTKTLAIVKATNAYEAEILGSSTVGSATKGIYLSNGSPAEMTYSLGSTVGAGTLNRIAYYKGAYEIAANGYIAYIPHTETAAESGTLTNGKKYIDGLRLWGTTVGNLYTVNGSSKPSTISGKTGDITFGDGGPQIQFSTGANTAQDGAIIFTDHDSAGAGASFHFVSNQADWNVHSKRFVARDSVTIGYQAVSNGAYLPNINYALFVGGSTLITGNTYIGSVSNDNLAATQGWVTGKGYQTSATEKIVLIGNVDADKTELTGKTVQLPLASTSKSGVVMIGNGLKDSESHLVIDTAWLTTQGFAKGSYLPLTGGEMSGNITFDGTAKGLFAKDGTGTYGLFYHDGTDLWIGVKESVGYHHKGATYISAGWNPTAGAGNNTVYVSVPKTNLPTGSNTYSNYAVVHAGMLKNNTTIGHLGWTATADHNLQPITTNTLAYWDGRYNANNSNLEYFKGGKIADVFVGVDNVKMVNEDGGLVLRRKGDNAFICGATPQYAITAGTANKLASITATYEGRTPAVAGNTVGYVLIGQFTHNPGTGGYRRSWATLLVGSRHNGSQIVNIIFGCEQALANFTLNNAFCDISQFGTTANSTTDDVFYCYAKMDGSNIVWSLFWRNRDYSPANITVLQSGGNATFTLSNGAWMTSIDGDTYGTLKGKGKRNPASFSCTLWGQTFDGSANVSGNMTGVGTIDAVGNIKITKDDGNFRVSSPSANEEYMFGASSSGYIYGSANGRYMTFLNGNVGIGTTSPAQKLDVSGSARVTGNLYVGGIESTYGISVGGKSVSLEGHTHSQYLTSGDLSSASVYWADYAGSANSAYSATTADSATSAAKADALKATTINYWSGQNSVEYRLIGQKLMYKTNGKQRGWMTLSIGSRHNGAQIVSIIYGCEQESANFNLSNAFCEIEQHGTLENSSADDVLYCHVLADSSNNLQFSFFWRHRDNSPVDIRVIASGGNAVFTPQAYSGTSQNFTESQLSSLVSSYGALFAKGQRRIGMTTSWAKTSVETWAKVWDIQLSQESENTRKEMLFMVSDPSSSAFGLCALRFTHKYANNSSNVKVYTVSSVSLEMIYGNLTLAQFEAFYYTGTTTGKVELWCRITGASRYFNFTVLKRTANGACDDAGVMGMWYNVNVTSALSEPTATTTYKKLVMTQKSVNMSMSKLNLGSAVFDEGYGPKVEFTRSNSQLGFTKTGSSTLTYYFDGPVSNNSDSRLKTIDKYLEPSVYDIAFAPLVAFRWKNGDSRQNVGTIAQYWEKILPQAVHENSDGFLSLEYSTIALAAGVTASRKAVDNERRIIDLERELAALKVRVAELEQEAA